MGPTCTRIQLRQEYPSGNVASASCSDRFPRERQAPLLLNMRPLFGTTAEKRPPAEGLNESPRCLPTGSCVRTVPAIVGLQVRFQRPHRGFRQFRSRCGLLSSGQRSGFQTERRRWGWRCRMHAHRQNAERSAVRTRREASRQPVNGGGPSSKKARRSSRPSPSPSDWSPVVEWRRRLGGVAVRGRDEGTRCGESSVSSFDRSGPASHPSRRRCRTLAPPSRGSRGGRSRRASRRRRGTARSRRRAGPRGPSVR